MARTTVALLLALVMVGCESESRLTWTDPFADSSTVRGYARDQIGLGVNGVEMKLTAPDGAEFVAVTRDVAPGDAGWLFLLSASARLPDIAISLHRD
jgi:hypothetical protein